MPVDTGVAYPWFLYCLAMWLGPTGFHLLFVKNDCSVGSANTGRQCGNNVEDIVISNLHIITRSTPVKWRSALQRFFAALVNISASKIVIVVIIIAT